MKDVSPGPRPGAAGHCEVGRGRGGGHGRALQGTLCPGSRSSSQWNPDSLSGQGSDMVPGEGCLLPTCLQRGCDFLASAGTYRQL